MREKVVEYIVHKPTGKFGTIQLVPESRLDHEGASPTFKSEVIDLDQSPADRVVFGRIVLLYNVQTEEEVEYQLLGPYESDPAKGKISVTSPLGQSLIGKEEGDEVKTRTPGGIKEYEILEVR